MANGDRRVEQGGVNVVKQVKDSTLLYYKVTVRDPSPPREITNSAGVGMGSFEIGSSFLCKIADFQYRTDNALRRNALRQVTISLAVRLPPLRRQALRPTRRSKQMPALRPAGAAFRFASELSQLMAWLGGGRSLT